MFKKKSKKKAFVASIDAGEGSEEEEEADPFSMGKAVGSNKRKKKMTQSSISAFGLGNEEATTSGSAAEETRRYEDTDLDLLKQEQKFAGHGTAETVAADTDLGIIVAGDEAEDAEVYSYSVAAGVEGVGIGEERVQGGAGSGSSGASAVETSEPGRHSYALSSRGTVASERLTAAGGAAGGIRQMLDLLASSVKEATDLGESEEQRALSLTEQLERLSTDVGSGDASVPASSPEEQIRLLENRSALLSQLLASTREVLLSVGKDEERVDALVGTALEVRRGALQAGGAENSVEAARALQEGLSRLEGAAALLMKKEGVSVPALCSGFIRLRKNLPELYQNAYLDECLEIVLVPLVKFHLALTNPFSSLSSDSAAESGEVEMDVEGEEVKAGPSVWARGNRGILGDATALAAIQELMAAGTNNSSSSSRGSGAGAGADGDDEATSLLAGLVKAAVLPWLRRCISSFFDPLSRDMCVALGAKLNECYFICNGGHGLATSARSTNVQSISGNDNDNESKGHKKGSTTVWEDDEVTEAILARFRKRMGETDGAAGEGASDASANLARVRQMAANLQLLAPVLPQAQLDKTRSELFSSTRHSRFDEQ